MSSVKNPKTILVCGAGAVVLATLSAFAVPLAQRTLDQWTPATASPRQQAINGKRDLGDWSMPGSGGSLNYTIDLPELPNRGEIKPQLALTYEFGSGDGAWGEHWNIESSSITQNSDKGIPLPRKSLGEDFYANFSRDGQRLKFLRNASIDPLTRQANQDNLIKVFAFDEAQLAETVTYYDKGFDVRVKDAHGRLVTEHLPSGFVVMAPNGAQSIYTGHPDEAEGGALQGDAPPHITRWPIKFEIYPGGESIRYDYKKIGGRAYLQNVSFAGGLSVYHFDLCEVGEAGCALATYSYDFSAGFGRESRAIHTRMQARFKGVTEQTWCMVYEARAAGSADNQLVGHPDCQNQMAAESGAWERSQKPVAAPLLRALIRQGYQNPASSMPALADPTLSFRYHHDRMEPGVQPQNVDRQGELHHRLAFSYLFDVNGDQRADLVSRSADGTTTLALGTGEADPAFQPPFKWTLQRRSGQNLISLAPYFEQANFQLADIDGDGFTDIVEMEPGSGKLYWYQRLPHFQFKEGQPILDRNSKAIALDPLGFATKSIQMIDVNGDRTADIVVMKKDTSSEVVKATIWLNRIWFQDKTWLYFAPQASTVLPMRQKAKAMERLSDETLRFLDVNGDGLPDFVESVDEGSKLGVCVYPNVGRPKDTFGSVELGKNQSDCENKGVFSSFDATTAHHIPGKLWMLDVDGDGQLDLVDYTENATELKIYYNGSSGFSFGQAHILSLGSVPLPVVAERANIRIADMDGDGSEDIIAVDPNPTHFESLKISFGQQAKPGEPLPRFLPLNHLTQVTSGTGMRIDFQYSDSRREGGNDPAFAQLPSTIPLLKQVVHGLTEKNAFQPHQVAISRYNYKEPLYDLFYGQMMGFKRVDDIQSLLGQEQLEKAGAQVTTTIVDAVPATDAAGVVPFATEVTEQIIQTWKLTGSQIEDWAQTIDWQDSLPNAGAIADHTLAVEADPSVTRKKHMQAHWVLVPIPFENMVSTRFWKRLTSSTMLQFEPLLPGESGSSKTKTTVSYQGFDEWNLPACDLVREDAIQGPLATLIPSQAIVSCRSYAASRQSLAPLSIIDAPAEECTGEVAFDASADVSCLNESAPGNVKVLSYTSSTYDVDHGRIRHRNSQSLDAGTTLPLPSLANQVPPEHVHVTIRHPDRSASYVYDATFGNLIEERDSVGTIFIRTFDDENGIRLLSEKNALNHETLYCYQDLCPGEAPAGPHDEERLSLVTRSRSPQGSWTQFTYDSLRRLKTETLDTGEKKDFCYREGTADGAYLVMTLENAPGEPCAARPSSAGSLFAFDAFGNRLYQADALAESSGQQAVYLHGFSQYFAPLGLVTKTFEVAKLEGTDLWDLFADSVDLDRGTQNLGVTVQHYDEAGEVIGTTWPAGERLEKTNQAWGQVYQETFLSNEARGDNKVRVTSQHRRLQQGDDAYAWIDRNAARRHAKRNAQQKIQEVAMDGESQPRVYLHNSFDELIYAEIPGVGAYAWQRDARGNATDEYHWDARGKKLATIGREFDALGRVTRVCVDGQDDSVFTFDSYEKESPEASPAPRVNQGCQRSLRPMAPALPSSAIGRMVKAVRFDTNKLFDSTESMVYDRQGRLLQRVTKIGPETSTSVLGYDANGHLETLRVQDPVSKNFVVQTFKLGQEGQVEGLSLITPEAQEPLPIVQSVAYGPQGYPGMISYGNGVTSRFDYDPSGRLQARESRGSQSLGPVLWQRETYGRDERGLLLDVTDEASDAAFVSGWTRISQRARYHYDKEQNLVEATAHGKDYIYRYGPAGSLQLNSEFSSQALRPYPLAREGDTTAFLSTGNGDGVWAYDGQGRLMQAPGLKSLEYDGLGQLVKAQTPDNTVRFGYSALGARIYKQVEGSTPTLYLGPFVHMIGGISMHNVWLWGSRTVSYIPSQGTWYHTLLDAQGSASLVLDAQGQLVDQLALTPYGQVMPLPADDAHADIRPLLNERRFGNQIFDAETGLYFLGGRYYNPRQGLHISPRIDDLVNPEVCLQSGEPCSFLNFARNNPIDF